MTNSRQSDNDQAWLQAFYKCGKKVKQHIQNRIDGLKPFADLNNDNKVILRTLVTLKNDFEAMFNQSEMP